MGVDAAVFQSGGQASSHLIPGAFSRYNFVKGAGGLASINNAVLLGECRGGEPNRVIYFSSPAEAESILIRGTLLEGLRVAFSPGGGYVPDKIGVLRVNPGTKASSIVKGSGGTIELLTLKAWDWGLHTNQVKRKIEAGTDAGTKKVTVQYQNQEPFIVDNIKRESFSIQYVGAGTAAALSITKTGLSVTVTGVPTDSISLDFESFRTVEDVVNYINDHAGYSASVVTGNSTELATHLDTVAAIAIKAAAYTAMSNLQALIDALKDCPWISEIVLNGTTPSRIVPDNDVAWVYFTGAVDGAYTATEWANSLAVLEKEDIQFIGTPATDESVHLMIKSHCERMNGVKGKRERQFIVGGAYGESISQIKTRTRNLGSNFGALCYPGFKHYDKDNNYSEFAPSYYACKEIGRQVVLALNEPATFKQVDVLEWEKKLSTSEIEDLIKAGAWVGFRDESGIAKNARSLTTYQGSDLRMCEFSIMREALFANRDLRTSLERAVVGRAMTNELLSEVDGIFLSKMATYSSELRIFNGVPQWWGYQRRINGDQIILDYDANLTPPTNFVFITAHMHIYVSSTTAE